MLCQCNIFPLCFCLSYLFGNTGLLRLSTRCQVASRVLIRVYAIPKNWRGGEDPRCILALPIKGNLKIILNNMKGTLKSDFEMLKKTRKFLLSVDLSILARQSCSRKGISEHPY